MRIVWTILIVFAIVLNLFGLMRFIPLYFTAPLLFIVFYLAIYYSYGRKTFKGYKKNVTFPSIRNR
ncbi:hypothetical protein ACFOZ1_03470 [Gracilibacillus marinus]|uniref:Uncharacterized protein n=1 Tax=Gracilibacillus marinus TaxID=630535 RepID=A0ABV8VVP0_9BACI